MSITCFGACSQRRSGKDSVADYLIPKLVSKVPRPVHGGITYEDGVWGRASFATPVKKIFCKTFNKDLEFIEEWKTKDEIPPGMLMPVRQALTFIGDGFRKIQADIWIETAFRPENDPYYKIFTDVRYSNEARKIKQEGGLNILLYRENGVNWDDNGSEREILPYVLWCAQVGKEGKISDWNEFREKKFLEIFPFKTDRVGDVWKTRYDFIQSQPTGSFNYVNGTADLRSSNVVKSEAIETFFDNLSQFDLFIRAADGVHNLHHKVDKIVLPYIAQISPEILV